MEVVLPKVALTMTEATIVAWFKQEGESVSKGELLFSMETDKSELEIESPGDGVLRKIRYGPGDTVQAGEVVATLESQDGAVPDQPAAMAQRDVSPAAAALAKELGVDVDSVIGTGAGGRVLESDVIKTADSMERSAPARTEEQRVEAVTFSRARQAGMRLTELSTRVPTFLLSGLLDFSEPWEEMEAAGVSVTDLLAVAAAGALRDVPIANARVNNRTVERYVRPRIGILVRKEDALVPLVFDDPSESDAVSFQSDRRAAADALESGRLAVERSTGATFVISNLGRFNVDFFSAVLFPETAITMAAGSLGLPPNPAHALRAVLTCDHRVVDGVDAAEFFGAVQERINGVRMQPSEVVPS